jgi:hypothetical protein
MIVRIGQTFIAALTPAGWRCSAAIRGGRALTARPCVLLIHSCERGNRAYSVLSNYFVVRYAQVSFVWFSQFFRHRRVAHFGVTTATALIVPEAMIDQAEGG